MCSYLIFCLTVFNVHCLLVIISTQPFWLPYSMNVNSRDAQCGPGAIPPSLLILHFPTSDLLFYLLVFLTFFPFNPRGAGVPPFCLCSFVHSLPHLFVFLKFFPFFSHLLYLFFPLFIPSLSIYQNRPTPFPGRRS